MTLDPALQLALNHQAAGRVAEAAAACQQILARQPENADALHILGMLAGQTGQLPQAVELMRQSLRLNPNRAAGRNNLGNVLRELGRLDEAEAEYLLAVKLEPSYGGAYRNLANVFNDRGRPDLALQALRKAVELTPSASELHSSLLYTLHFHQDYDSAAILREHRLWADRHARPLYPKKSAKSPFSNSRLPDRRLRIGYVSADFHSHVAGRMIKPLLANHDHRQFAIVCYADVAAPDSVTAELKSMSDEWYPCYQMPDEQLAKYVRKNGIDILVDLAQHSGSNRMLVFARKPAPVQISWLGYPSTTGLETIDYRLTDPYLDPPGQGDEHYSEKSYRLPKTFWCYQPIEGQSEPVAPPPQIANGFITFGCMNRFSKVTRMALTIWRRILQLIPNSRLRLHSQLGTHLDPVRAFFRQGGIADDRLIFIPRQPLEEYLRQYHAIDIAFDPMPHGGGTTTGDALWMGVPVITLAGKTAVGRGAASILSNIGAPKLIAKSPEEYVAIAVALAADLSGRAHLRATLRQRMQSSPLMDAAGFARDIESAYRHIWREWCGNCAR
jgi:predicted O-linked N-acetylglucosamine transferase (SPINDLY family)